MSRVSNGSTYNPYLASDQQYQQFLRMTTGIDPTRIRRAFSDLNEEEQTAYLDVQSPAVFPQFPMSQMNNGSIYNLYLAFDQQYQKFLRMTTGIDPTRIRRAFSEFNEEEQTTYLDVPAVISQFPTIIETTNYDGKIIWKIRDFRRRLADAKRGGALSIYSQPFYTSRYGYKMCLRLFLNGDGMGRNTHISLFFVLMKGEYDALLPFPFKQKVSLHMLDHSSQDRHLSDTFRPDPTSSSFKRPNCDMNIAFGYPMFVPHDALNNTQYVVDDTIFIKAVVDTTDLKKI